MNARYMRDIGCSFKFPDKIGVEESIVNALRITDHLFKSYVFTRVVRSQSTFNANFDRKFK
jgi:uridylate kinase